MPAPEFNLHMAKVYLCQAQATKWRHWKFWLLDAAAKRRREHLQLLRSKRIQVIAHCVQPINQHGQWSLF